MKIKKDCYECQKCQGMSREKQAQIVTKAQEERLALLWKIVHLFELKTILVNKVLARYGTEFIMQRQLNYINELIAKIEMTNDVMAMLELLDVIRVNVQAQIKTEEYEDIPEELDEVKKLLQEYEESPVRVEDRVAVDKEEVPEEFQEIAHLVQEYNKQKEQELKNISVHEVDQDKVIELKEIWAELMNRIMFIEKESGISMVPFTQFDVIVAEYLKLAKQVPEEKTLEEVVEDLANARRIQERALAIKYDEIGVHKKEKNKEIEIEVEANEYCKCESGGCGNNGGCDEHGHEKNNKKEKKETQTHQSDCYCESGIIWVGA